MIKAYEKYKDSEFEWIKEIPTTWSTASMNHLVEFIMGQAPHSDSYNSDGDGEIFIKTGDFGVLRPNIKWYTTNPLVFASEEDVFMCVVGATSGKVNLGVNATISRSIAALRPKKRLLQKYLYYYLAYNYQRLNDSAQGSAQGIINKTILAGVKVPIPTLSEQTKIAQYLDHQTAIIDQLIQQKEKLIELLKEKRQAVINEAVTKGLNPNAKMKDSGIEWIGEVPENWKVLNFRYVIDVLTDFTANGSFADLAKNVTYLETGYSRLIRLTDLRENLNNNGLYVSEDSHNYLSKSSLYGDEVLLANVGAYAGLAWKVPQLSIPSTLGPNMFLLKFNKSLNNDFAYYSLISSYLCDQLRNKAVSAAQPKLNKEDVRSCLFVQPPIKEQIEIVHFLSEINGKYEKLINLEIAQIEKIKEYRQAIISEAVTGKIDVRDWQPNKQQVA